MESKKATSELKQDSCLKFSSLLHKRELIDRKALSLKSFCNTTGKSPNRPILTKMRRKWRKKNEIIELLVKWRLEIARGQVRVMFLDECHLLWGDVSGYGWSRRCGASRCRGQIDPRAACLTGRALDYLTKSFVVSEYSAGNEVNTVAFLKYLQSLYDESTRGRDYLGWCQLPSFCRGSGVSKRGSMEHYLLRNGKSLVFDWHRMPLSRIRWKMFGCWRCNSSVNSLGCVKSLGLSSCCLTCLPISKPLLFLKLLCTAIVHLLFRIAIHPDFSQAWQLQSLLCQTQLRF